MGRLVGGLAFAVGLTLATSASAECVWVLWGRESSSDAWAPRDTYSTEMGCRNAIREGKGPLSSEQRKVRELRRPDLARQDYFECWPDTVDPRGPKGS